MSGSRSSNEPPEPKSTGGGVFNNDTGDDSDDESAILEESPCGRWAKRKEQVDQRDVPGIDNAYLAMDTEEGVEVVWNEVLFSERKNLKAQEEKICLVFDNLTLLEHPNIVKFHKYWMDMHTDRPRVVFITEYMSSGSLKQFLKRTKRNVKRLPVQAWKRWCTQILSALSYLHSCTPPIIHGNLTCDTIFIQHNGLVKIGSVAPDAIYQHVKSCRENMKNLHFVAPEYGGSAPISSAVDIYAFGICALEMTALEIQGNGDSGNVVTEDHVNRTIESLEEGNCFNDFIRKCLNPDPSKRPSARELLFHPELFEVPSLKLLSAHSVVSNTVSISDSISDEVLHRHYGPENVVAEIRHKRRGESDEQCIQYRMSDVPVSEKLEKFVEDVKFGIYPLTCFEIVRPFPLRPQASSPDVIDSVKSLSPEPSDVEFRRVMNMMCNVKSRDDEPGLIMTILVRMDDKMNRQLSCLVNETDTAYDLASELIFYGFIHEAILNSYISSIAQADRDRIQRLIEDSLYNRGNGGAQQLSPTNMPNLNFPPGSGDISVMGGNGSVVYPIVNHQGVSTSCS